MAERPSAPLGDVELKKKVAELESSIAELKGKISMLPTPLPGAKPITAEPLVETLKAALGEHMGLLEIMVEGDTVILRPKRYLGAQRFRTVIDIVKKHGGNWTPERRTFIIRKKQS